MRNSLIIAELLKANGYPIEEKLNGTFLSPFLLVTRSKSM